MTLNYDHYAQTVRKRERSLKKHSAQIGRLCVLWSSLEFDVTVFLTVIAPMSDAAVKNVFMGSMDFRAKLHALLAIGFKKKPNDAWYADLAQLVSTIDSSLRTERNRMVHDFWYTIPTKAGTEEINRVQIKPRVVNEQARTKKLQLADLKPVTAADIASVCDTILDANVRLLVLQHRYEWTPSPAIPENRLQN
jgi:hypothetical protein